VFTEINRFFYTIGWYCRAPWQGSLNNINPFYIFCLSTMPTGFLVRMVQYIALSFSEPGSLMPFVKMFLKKIPFKFPKNDYFSRKSVKGQLPTPLLLILSQP